MAKLEDWRAQERRLLDHARIPPRFRNAEVTQSPAIQDFVRQLPANLKAGRGLLLIGPPDSGKSTTASAICRAALRTTAKVMYIPAPDLAVAVNEGEMFDEDITMRAALRSRDLLVIDDLGDEVGVSPSEGQKTANLIRYRVNHQKATILATSLTEELLGHEYGPDLLALLRRAFTFVRTSPSVEYKHGEEIVSEQSSSPKLYSKKNHDAPQKLLYNPELLRRAKEKHRHTLANMTEHFGVRDESTVSRWLHGKIGMSVQNAKRYDEYIKVLSSDEPQ